MSFRLVPKSVTLNGVMALTLRYFTEFGKPTLQHITPSARIQLIDEKAASIPHKSGEVCVRN